MRYEVQNRFTISIRAMTSNVIQSVMNKLGIQAYLNWY